MATDYTTCVTKCDHCPALVSSRKRICQNEFFTTLPVDSPKILVVSESPGIEEDKRGRPFVGASGEEARHHLAINGIAGYGIILDNICKCRPDANRDVRSAEIRACTGAHLVPLIKEMKPKWVITMGAISTRFFIGSITMEMAHGIPRTVDFHGQKLVVIPTYHPASGLHNPEQMILFHSDMKVAGEVIKGHISPNPPIDKFRKTYKYRQVESAEQVKRIVQKTRAHQRTGALTHSRMDDPGTKKTRVIAIDTEWARGQPWCLSFSVVAGESWVVMRDQQAALDALGSFVGKEEVRTIIQNALYDLPVLDQMGIRPATVADTMVMAYLLQTEPQGLKALAYRHCGMVMNNYKDMVGAATERMALEYLLLVDEMDWPNPPPVLEWKKGKPHVRQPQNMSRKVAAMLKKGDELAKRWKNMKDGKGVVEEILGPLQEGELCDIDRDKAIDYSARDADATLRIYPILWQRIVKMGLEDTFWRDMRAMPMVVDMMANGMPVDRNAFAELSVYFQSRMDTIQQEMQKSVGHYNPDVSINPASYPQMSALIYDHLRLHEKGGRHKSKKGAVKKSTADDILKRYVRLHPCVQQIMDWRGYQKLKTSYADAIPKLMGDDERIRTTIRMTRTTTGRLSSSNPNLMAQPIRSSEGRKVRDCYKAPEGKVLVSGDYSQVEMRVAADGAKDERMMDIFWRGDDIHSITASEMFGVPIRDLDEMKHRYPAKRVGFGILNLITAEGLHRELISGGADMWTVDDCRDMVESWFKIYRGIAAYMKESGNQAKRYGYVRDMWGRLRYIPGVRSTNRWIRIEAERQAGNAPIQMGAQGVIKEAMGQLVPIYREWEINPLIQIHDDIVWEMDEWKAPIVLPVVKKIMEGVTPADFIVPLNVDFKVGRKWGSMKGINP